MSGSVGVLTRQCPRATQPPASTPSAPIAEISRRGASATTIDLANLEADAGEALRFVEGRSPEECL